VPARRLSLHPMRLCPSPCGGDLRAARRGRMPRLRGDARSRELRPNPIRPDTSRHRTVATSEGNPTPCAVDSAEAMPPARTIPSHAPFTLASSRLVGPRTPRLRRPSAASARFHGRAGKPNGYADDPLARSTTHHPARFDERAACATRPPGPRAASPAAPRRAPRSAAPEVPSIDEPPPSRTPNLRPAVRSFGRAFSTDCHQPVDSARRPFHSCLDGDLDGSAWTEARSPL
jgi:hypothetical protein